MSSERPLRVLIIDDSAYNRKVLGEFLGATPGVEVVGKASDGEEGLKMAVTESPDVITLDLEMPRMDGFTFLRLLMAARPVPVIVISSHAASETVFKALELGALDFVAKPTHRASPEIEEIRDEVVRKVSLARSLRRDSLVPVFGGSLTGTVVRPLPEVEETSLDDSSAQRVVALAASTGGPAALTGILSSLPGDLGVGVVVAQHMPPQFTTSFAARLDRLCRLRVTEAQGTEPLKRSTVRIAPGEACLEVARGAEGLVTRVVPPREEDRYVPSGNRLFESAAAAVPGSELLAVVLTGMGDDGALGAEAVAAAGGRVMAESENTAVISGMPLAAIGTGAVTRIVPLHRIAEMIIEFAAG